MVSEAPPIDATPGRGGAGLWSPEHRSLTIGLLLTITLVATEALAVATVMPEVRADLGGYALYGWVFSGFFLASIVGIVAGGRTADRTGLATPFLVGVVVFACGLVVAGLSQSMLVLVVGRLLQGLGAGAVPAVAYAAIARALPSSLRPRMFAMLSTAWVVPGLLGPAAAAAIEHALTWRWVFLGLLPLVVLAAALAVPALAGVTGHVPAGGASDAGPEPSAPGDHDARALPVAAVVAGVGAVLGAAADAPLLLAGALVAVGVPLATWGFAQLVPSGTLKLRPGVPATVAMRGLLTWSFFSADAYVSYAIIDGRGESTWWAGAALSAGSVMWALGSWFQASRIERVGPRTLVGTGLSCILVGNALALGVGLGLPVIVMVVAWGIGGAGMGMSYAPLSLVVLGAAEPGRAGAASAALHLSDVVGTAVGTGIGGGIVAFAAGRGWAPSSGAAVVFAHSVLMTAAALVASRRLPTRVPTQPTERSAGRPDQA